MRHKNYMLVDDDSNEITNGLQPHEARRVAQRIADERGETVWLSPSSGADADAEEACDTHEGERFDPAPAVTPADRAILRAADGLLAALCADHGIDPALAGEAADALSALLADREPEDYAEHARNLHPARVVFEAGDWREEAGFIGENADGATWAAFLRAAGGAFNVDDAAPPRGFVEVQRDDTLDAFHDDADYAVNVAAPASAYWRCEQTGALYPIAARPRGEDFEPDPDESEAEARWFRKQATIAAGLGLDAAFVAVVHVDVAVERGLIEEETAHALLCGEEG